MSRAGVCWLALLLVSSAAIAAPPDVSPEPVKPYEYPPFTRFPDEPADLPPLPRHESTPVWRVVLDALDGTKLHVIAGISAPLEVAAGLELVFPWRIRLGTTVGVLPRAVGRAVNAQLVDRDVYSRSLGDLVDASLERVLLWHIRMAVQPWANHGFLLAAGYGVALLHGETTVPLVAAAVGMTVPDDVPVAESRFELASRLHLVDVALGWEWRLRRHWMIGISIGAAITVSARTRVTLEPSGGDVRVRELGIRAAASLDEAFTTYVKTPLLSSFVGYEF